MIKPDEEINEIDDVTPFVYIYVRTDIPPVQQLIQAAHAAHEAGIMFGKHDSEDGKDNISHFCVFAVTNEERLFWIHKRFMQKDIGFHMFYEPDFNMGYSAIATEPLVGERRTLVPNNQLLRLPKRHIW